MPMRTNYVLIDFENVQVKSLELLKPEHFRVYVFLGPTQARLPRSLAVAVQKFAGRAEYIEVEKAGPEALDFHVAYYIGTLSKVDPEGYFHVISGDTGFDSLIAHLKTLGVYAARSLKIEEMPCFKTAAAPAASVDSNGHSTEALVKLALSDLAARKSAKPRRVKTLLSTIHSRCGKELSTPTIQSVLDAMVRDGHVLIDGDKVSYGSSVN